MTVFHYSCARFRVPCCGCSALRKSYDSFDRIVEGFTWPLFNECDGSELSFDARKKYLREANVDADTTLRPVGVGDRKVKMVWTSSNQKQVKLYFCDFHSLVLDVHQ